MRRCSKLALACHDDDGLGPPKSTRPKQQASTTANPEGSHARLNPDVAALGRAVQAIPAARHISQVQLAQTTRLPAKLGQQRRARATKPELGERRPALRGLSVRVSTLVKQPKSCRESTLDSRPGLTLM